jgi:hypothetical protein
MQQQLLLRKATAADQAAVLHFCANTWEGGDYIAEVWDDWLNDSSSMLTIVKVKLPPKLLVRLTKCRESLPR